VNVTPLDPPRRFRVGEIEISHVADVELDADEQVTFTTAGGTEFDVVRKVWGYYATPSLNRRLPEHGLRPALCRSPDGRTVVLLCELGQEDSFVAYLEKHRLEVLGWLDREYCPMCRMPGMEPHFHYDARPEGETLFDLRGEHYRREVLRCPSCGHFVSQTPLDLSGLYDGDYLDATYAGDQLRTTYERIMSLPAAQSDNAARVARIVGRLGTDGRVLDVGSGLGVFPARMQEAGWQAVALDPDPRAAEHTRSVIGIEHVQADFFAADLDDLETFDLVTLNKVLEHVEDPVAMLARAGRLLADGGCVYIELPDGEAAAEHGPGREEFFVEHLHVFSLASMALLANHAGLRVVRAERLFEPSTKYTLFAFCVPA
jgi:SAM-dependent methyltransferase